MSKNKKINMAMKVLAGFAVVSLLSGAAYAATDSDTTTINANIGSTISVDSGPTVSINITPVLGGSQSSASDTVTLSTNNANGYSLTIEDADADTDLVNGGDTIGAHAGTQGSPTALANNSWGYAVPNLGSFDASYSTLNNATSSSSLWAGVPASGSPNTIDTDTGPVSNATTTVWYSVKADTTNPNGTYTDQVTYTGTTTP